MIVNIPAGLDFTMDIDLALWVWKHGVLFQHQGKPKFKFHALESNKSHHLEIQRHRQIDIQSRCAGPIEMWQKPFSGSGRKVRVPAGQQLLGGSLLIRF